MSSKKPSPEEIQLFRQEMTGVKPLPGDHTAPELPKPAPRRRKVQDTPTSGPGFALRELAAPVDPDEELFFARSGPQHKLLRRLKAGELSPEAKLDLHGNTIAEAGNLLAQFIQHSTQAGHRCVLVVHGKGHRSEAGRPALKTQVNHWLRDHSDVLAFCSAQPRDGGNGAIYILLRRAEKNPR